MNVNPVLEDKGHKAKQKKVRQTSSIMVHPRETSERNFQGERFRGPL
jgi:hypothetical protein